MQNRVLLKIIVVLAIAPLGGCAGFFERHVDGYEFMRALNLQKEGRRSEALAIYRSLEPVERRYPGVLNNMGVICAQLGRLSQAEALMVEAARVENDEPAIWTNLGVVRFLMQRHDEARQALEEAQPAAQRRLAEVSGSGRVNWDYQDARERAGRSVDKAEAYIKLIDQRVADRNEGMRRPDWLPGALSLLKTTSFL